jgi:nucleolar protein 58
LKTFSKFENTADAMENISAIVEGKVAAKLASLLQDLNEKSASLIVSDPKLGMRMKSISTNYRGFDQSNPKIIF